MKRNVSVVCVCSRCNILISGKIIKEMPGSVASGTSSITTLIPLCDTETCKQLQKCDTTGLSGFNVQEDSSMLRSETASVLRYI